MGTRREGTTEHGEHGVAGGGRGPEPLPGAGSLLGTHSQVTFTAGGKIFELEKFVSHVNQV